MPHFIGKSQGAYRGTVGSYPGEDLPVIKIRIEHPEIGSFEAAEAIVDSGSPMCMLPQKVADELILVQQGDRTLVTLAGTSIETPVYYPSVSIQGWKDTFPAVRFGSHSSEEVIIGRSLLNRMVTVLDGPSGTLELGALED